MAGVEPNPGPADKLVFRYEYLLIEVGTKVLRNVFEQRVGNDFVRYLKENQGENKKLIDLTKRFMNETQKKLFPPIDNEPDSSKFDITLLVLLLRNVCGLKDPGNPVWKKPATQNVTVEAEIARLRDSRNNLFHLGTVYASEADCTTWWNNLCEILKRLGSYCKMTNIQTLIDDAKHIDLDQESRKRLHSTVNAWDESERLFELKLSKLEVGH